MDQSFKKHLLTHGLAIIGFFLVTVIIYLPQFTEGKKMSQHDILQGQGGNHSMIEYREQTGEEALWMNSMFSGMPAYLNGVQFSGDLIKPIYNAATLYLNHPRGVTFLGCVSFYILLLVFGVRPWIAIMGAIAFSLNGFNMIGISAGHNAKIAAVALMPLVLAGVHLTFKNKKILGIGLTALALAMQLRIGHYQITYYLFFIILAYLIVQLIKAIKEKNFKPVLINGVGLALAAVLALGANAGKLWTVYEYSKVSIRGKSELKSEGNQSSGLDRDYAFEFSNGIFEPLVLFIPNIYGGSSAQPLSENSATADALKSAGYNRAQIKDTVKSMPTYWGDQRLSAPYYAGTVIFLLFIAGIFFMKKEEKIWLIVLACLGIVLSWGSSFSAFNDLLFDYLPMYNKFRSVTFAIIITILAMNLLGFQALEKIVSKEWDKAQMKKLFQSLAIPAGLALLLVIGAGALSYRGAIDSRLPDWLVASLREDRASLLRMDALRALFFLTAFSALVWAYAKKKLSTNIAIGLMILLVSFDSINLTKRFINNDSFKKDPSRAYFQPTEADKLIMKNAKSGERVLNLQNPFNEARTSYYHESLGGYHGAKIRRYQDLIERAISPEMQTLIQGLQKGRRDFAQMGVINMLNAKFLLAGQTKDAVLPNAYALGNAWIVNDVREANSPDEELQQTSEIDTKNTAVVDASKFNIPNTAPNASGSINVEKRTPNEITYKANITGGDALAVFSEIYYAKGWKATVDDQPVDILRANYVLRALPISQGQHTIKFVFEPSAYFVGNTITLICSVIVILLMIIGLALTFKENKA